MADSKVIAKLDQRLIAEGIIDKTYGDDYITVHRMLNALIRKSGGRLNEKTFEKGEMKLRTWLVALYKQGASQEKLTSYLRIGLAHLSFDFVESSYRAIDTDDLIARTLVSFKKRDFHKTYFKAPEIKKTRKKAVKKVKKKSPVKKKAKKKKKIKPVKKSKKKTIKRRTTAKKRTAGKRTAKRSVKKAKRTVKRSRKTAKKRPAKKVKPKRVKLSRRRSSVGILKKLFG